jgi:argininosuccinate synthase
MNNNNNNNEKTQIENKEKVILAFSGGLDTTFCVVHLKEKGYDVVTATINTGGFSEEKLKEIEKKSISLGASKHYSINAENEIYNNIISKQIQMNGLYQGDYPLMCADRYIISEKLIEIAKEEKTNIVAHGSTANGNDQVRFNTLLPNIKILEPIKYLNLTRDEEIKFLENKGIEVNKNLKKYSINENIFGNTVSGSEIDKNKEPSKDAYSLTKVKLDNLEQTEYITLTFKNGKPVAINGKIIEGLDILKTLNKIVGKYGWGSSIYTGDCIIGIKGHLMFESPGLLALIEAHKKLEQYTLTKEQIAFNKYASEQWTNFVYNGLYYNPLVKNIETMSNDMQKVVSGEVKIKLEKNKLAVVEIKSDNSLINEKIATYAQKGTWTIEEVNGFIKLYSMQQKIAFNNKTQ